ncbi:caspase-8 isoform X2 [Cheilinus undulatus]|uniref:caspase-8 isoform X2 n=1 Tax=Cheilinus undulatus TaxID=241271 RepID=UPI001BD6AFE5|nr:caspase-8 isoform X2 [Cheilinus undulatus]
MVFQKQLLDAGRALSRDEVKALAFLCSDLLGRNTSSVESATDLFTRLKDQDFLSDEQPHLLTELLLIIQRTRLIRELGLPDRTPTTRNLISPYRKLLYELSEDLTDENLKEIKFLLNGKLPRRKLEENVTTLEVFLEMEQMDLINNTDLKSLELLLQFCCPVLTEKINRFKEQQVPHSGLIAQETGRPRSMTYPLEPNNNQSTMSSFTTSMDFTNVAHGGDNLEDLSHEMSGLSTRTGSCSSMTVRTDALAISQSELNVSSSEKQVAPTTNTNTEELGSYPMNAEKRGFCLIINNHDFSKSKQYLQRREGTMVDEERLIKVFEWLQFDTEIKRDCKREDMLSALHELSRRDHSNVDCLVCCILSHGELEGVFGVDGVTVSLKELREPFNGLMCPSLADKPKLFFIQACQGNDLQKPVDLESDGPSSRHVVSDAVKYSIPSDADFLLAMSTVPSFVSFRERVNGTWFIQTLCQNLVQMVPRGADLVSILTKVNGDVSKKTDITGQKKQMPQPAFTLRKKVVFPKPSIPPPAL